MEHCRDFVNGRVFCSRQDGVLGVNPLAQRSVQLAQRSALIVFKILGIRICC